MSDMGSHHYYNDRADARSWWRRLWCDLFHEIRLENATGGLHGYYCKKCKCWL